MIYCIIPAEVACIYTNDIKLSKREKKLRGQWKSLPAFEEKEPRAGYRQTPPPKAKKYRCGSGGLQAWPETFPNELIMVHSAGGHVWYGQVWQRNWQNEHEA
jgi:hypothetical protein